MAALSDMLVYLRKRKALSQQELAEKLGLTRSAIGMYETGKREPDLETLEAFADFYNVDMDTLTGRANGSISNPRAQLSAIPNIVPLPRTYKVPLLGDIACGEPIFAEENYNGEVAVPDNIHADFALRCKGDSMIGARIRDGDLVFVRQQEDVDNGEIAAVLIEDEATLKRVYKYPDKLVLTPENPKYEPLVYIGYELENVRILGRAVAFLSVI